MFQLTRRSRLFCISILSMCSVFWANAAFARTSLQLETGEVISFDGGSLDMATGSGQMTGVIIEDRGEIILSADYLNIAAEGTPGSVDWMIRDLQMKNAEFPEAQMFVNEVVLRDIAVGEFSRDTPTTDVQGVVTEDTLARLRNISIEADEALISIDQISTLPITLGMLGEGQQVVTDGGLAVSGLTIMPLNTGSDRPPFLDELEARGITEVTADLEVSGGIRSDGTHLQLGYDLLIDIRDLAGLSFGFDMQIDSNVYSQLLPMLENPEDNAAAMLGISGAVALTNAELVIDDRGLLDIMMGLAAAEEGISEAEYRTTARFAAVQSLQALFPEKSPLLTVPLEDFMQQGGRLNIAMMPAQPVPLSGFIGFMMLPDLAIDQLGVQVAHTR